ncbi:putative oxidoreductase TM_0325 isoform X2 [Clavelina lepadiformis]|uniref:putative oxidoreductase TM_0325 isoform X2 n=1 Tax=Clavelina lepadiformis TaxID=159417 RepID=UPI004043625A
MNKFSSKVVLITGASSGIGAETAQAFAKCQVTLCITGRNKENLAKIGEQCRRLGANHVLEVIADLEKPTDIKELVKEVIKEFAQIDILVNNAGILFGGGVANTNLQDFDTTFNVNVKAPLYLTQLCLPFLKKSKELAKYGIRVNSVNPGLCHTNILNNWIPDPNGRLEEFKNDEKFHPLGSKNIQVDEIADAILFLASDRAKMITGSCLKVDGGRALTGQ